MAGTMAKHVCARESITLELILSTDWPFEGFRVFMNVTLWAVTLKLWTARRQRLYDVFYCEAFYRAKHCNNLDYLTTA